MINDLRRENESHKEKEVSLLEQLKEQMNISRSALNQVKELQDTFHDTKKMLTTDIETLLNDKEVMKVDLENYYQRRFNDKLSVKIE